jgi:hypothetical protein
MMNDEGLAKHAWLARLPIDTLLVFYEDTAICMAHRSQAQSGCAKEIAGAAIG